MATIKIKRNKSDASAKPTSLQEGELAVNLLDRSLFTNDGSKVVKLYTGEDKYFSEDGFANKALDATKLGGQLPSYYATAIALEALWEEIGGTGSEIMELLEGFIPLSRDFSDDFNNDFTR